MFLIKQAHHSVVCQLDLKGFDGELAVISGRAQQVRRMQRIIASRGADPNDWLPHFIAEAIPRSDRRRPMRSPKCRVGFCLIFASFAAAPAAWAQWAVVDAPAIVQLIQEVQTAAQQLQTTKDQLLQARQALQTMTGERGMEQLLGGTLRNYLPSNWTQVTGALQGSGGFSALSAEVQSIVAANAVLSPQRLAALSPAGATIHSKFTTVERHATSTVASGIVERQQSVCGHSNSDLGNLLGRGSEEHFGSTSSDQRRTRHAAERADQGADSQSGDASAGVVTTPARAGSRSSTATAASPRVFSRHRKGRWDSSQHFGRG